MFKILGRNIKNPLGLFIVFFTISMVFLLLEAILNIKE